MAGNWAQESDHGYCITVRKLLLHLPQEFPFSQGASICPWCAHREGKRKSTEDKPKPKEGQRQMRKKKAGEEIGNQVIRSDWLHASKYRATMRKTLQRRLRSGINHHPMAWLCSSFALPKIPDRARTSFSFFTQARQQEALFGTKPENANANKKMNGSYLLPAFPWTKFQGEAIANLALEY